MEIKTKEKITIHHVIDGIIAYFPEKTKEENQFKLDVEKYVKELEKRSL